MIVGFDISRLREFAQTLRSASGPLLDLTEDITRMRDQARPLLDGVAMPSDGAPDTARRPRHVGASLPSMTGEIIRRIAILQAVADLAELGIEAPADVAFALDTPLPEPAMSPVEASTWWSRLSPADRRAVVATHPRVLGGLDGIPAAGRDAANRILLARDLRELGARERAGTLADAAAQALENARAVHDSLRGIVNQVDPHTGEPLTAQLYIYEPRAFGGDGRGAVATGDLDTAEHVALAVPGMGTTVAGMSPSRALNVYEESRLAAPLDSVAVVDWVGYDAPSGAVFDDLSGVLAQAMARAGADRLAADVEGIRAMRGDDRPHLTVMGNSYGSTTTALAGSEEDLAADDIVLTGSPGAGRADDAEDLSTGRDHTWVGSASRDFVTSLGVTGWVDPTQVAAPALDIDPGLMGNDPAEDEFEAQRFRAESVERGDHWNVVDHGRYYAPDTESLYNIAAVVTGQYEKVQRAEHRYDPLLDAEVGVGVGIHHDGGPFGLPGVDVDLDADVDAAMQDPERDREPEELNHGD